MRSKTAAGRTVAGVGVESAPLDGTLRQIQDGMPSFKAEGTSARVPPTWGAPLTESDYASFEASWISRDITNAAMVRRVDANTGREIVGQKGQRDCAGLLIPYYWPGDPHPRSYRIRRDRPDLTADKDGKEKLERKYLAAPGSANRLYIPPGITQEELQDVSIPIILCEGEKKALALCRLSKHGAEKRRFVPVAIPGVWNWRSTVGKTGGPNGERLDVKGPIPDLNRIAWKEREVFILFDANVHTNDSVKWARTGIARELATRHAIVKFINLPADCGVNGVDDLLASWGPTRVLVLFEAPVEGMRLQVVQSPVFQTRAEGLFRVTKKGEVLSEIQLTNYRASIVTNTCLDDGVEERREFDIKSELLGRSYRFNIPASEFARMDWPIVRMGAGAITFPNQREYARTAIQSSSLTAEERSVYAHTGWRKVDNQWLFLHADGAIGSAGVVSGIAVRLSGTLDRYRLQQSADSGRLVSTVRSSLQLVELGPAPICFPLLAATFRAVFGNSDFAVHVAGPTGAFKSELAALH